MNTPPISTGARNYEMDTSLSEATASSNETSSGKTRTILKAKRRVPDPKPFANNQNNPPRSVSTCDDYNSRLNFEQQRIKMLENAIAVNDKDTVKRLLDNGVDPNSQNVYGTPMFFYSIVKNNVEILELFIQKGIDINFIDPNGNTAVSVASINNNDQIKNMLSKAGARFPEFC